MKEDVEGIPWTMHVIEMTKIGLKLPNYLCFYSVREGYFCGWLAGIRHTLAWHSVSLQVVLVTGLFAFFGDLRVMLRVKWDCQCFVLSVSMHHLCTDSFHNALLCFCHGKWMYVCQQSWEQTYQTGLGYKCLSSLFCIGGWSWKRHHWASN